jgi:hypothetical protein
MNSEDILHGIITNGQAKFYNNPKTKHIGY